MHIADKHSQTAVNRRTEGAERMTTERRTPGPLIEMINTTSSKQSYPEISEQLMRKKYSLAWKEGL